LRERAVYAKEVIELAMGITIRQWVEIATAIGELALAVFVLSQRRPSALKAPLALLCLDVAAWTAASPAYDAYRPLSVGIDRVFSPLTAPLALDFVLVFTGRRRSSPALRTIAFLLGGSLSTVALVTLSVPRWRWFVQTDASQIWLACSALPTMGAALLVLARHRDQTTDREERARTSVLLVALSVATLLGVTDSVGEFAHWLPHMADYGMVVGASGMAIVTFGFRLLGPETPRRVGVAVAVSAALTLYACAAALGLGGTKAVAILVVTLAIGIALLAATRQRIIALGMRADLTERLATLGRVSAQVEHDVRNPLAALKGAAQLLKRDLARPQSAIDRIEFANLIIGQANRIETILDRYRRLARLELHRSVLQVNDVVRSVISRQASAIPEQVVVRSDLDPTLPLCLADGDLLATILENLARNSLEAMPQGGTLTLRTRADAGPGIELSVEDTGLGMDARTRERATDDFFTTKAQGSGFGLAFTKRVADAHGARLTITSQVGRGTQIRLRLPAHVA
jgi:signal transduction histidine kinase